MGMGAFLLWAAAIIIIPLGAWFAMKPTIDQRLKEIQEQNNGG